MKGYTQKKSKRYRLCSHEDRDTNCIHKQPVYTHPKTLVDTTFHVVVQKQLRCRKYKVPFGGTYFSTLFRIEEEQHGFDYLHLIPIKADYLHYIRSILFLL